MELDDLYRREAQRALGGRQGKASLAVTSYDKAKHAVKGILLPYEVETDWIPLASYSAGDGYGIMIGPNVGSAENLDGDIMDVEFENGDPNTPIAKHKHFSQADNPPEVESGEILHKHQGGGSTLFKKDNSIITTHAGGGQHMFDKDGNHTLTTKDKNVTIDAGKGSHTFKAKSQTFSADTHSFSGKVNVSNDINQTQGNLTSSGNIVGASVNSTSDGHSL